MENRSRFSIIREELLKLSKEFKKIAMAVPLPENIRSQMAKEGVYALLEKNPALPNLGKEAIQNILKDLQNTGASEFFRTLDPNTALQLPYILKPSRESMVEIDGKQYYVVDVSESRPIKKRQTINGIEYQKGDNYPGEVILMDIDTGNPVTKTFDDVKDKIRVPSNIREESLREINEEISAWNKKVESIEKATGVTKLALQVSSAENKIQQRIEQLESQKTSLERAIQNPLDVSPAYGAWLQFLRDNYQTFGARDIFDTLLFLYQASPQELISGIESGQIQVPEEIKPGLLSVTTQEIGKKEEELRKQRQKEEEKIIRKETPITEEKEPKEEPIYPMTLEELPEKKYKTPPKYKTLHSWAASLRRIVSGIEEDKKDLQNVISTLSGLRKYVGALEKGQRSEDYLRSTEGKIILDDMKRFLDACSIFFKRYSIDIIKNGRIDPSLLGRAGTIGNALISARLNNIYNIIKRTVNRAEGIPEEQLVEQVRIPIEEPVSEPMAYTKDVIIKMSEGFLNSFTRRTALK